jgi:RNA polymerase sigma-70 factor (ECF subfamily)
LTAEEFEAVYERTRRALRAYLLRAGGSASLADDLVQETYTRYLGLDAEARAAPEAPLLFRLASHALYDHFRQLRRAERFLLARVRERAGGEPARDSRLDDATDLGRAFAALSPRERALLWLAHVEGQSHREVAAAMKVRPESVRVLLFRARRALAALLRHDPDPGGGS